MNCSTKSTNESINKSIKIVVSWIDLMVWLKWIDPIHSFIHLSILIHHSRLSCWSWCLCSITFSFSSVSFFFSFIAIALLSIHNHQSTEVHEWNIQEMKKSFHLDHQHLQQSFSFFPLSFPFFFPFHQSINQSMINQWSKAHQEPSIHPSIHQSIPWMTIKWKDENRNHCQDSCSYSLIVFLLSFIHPNPSFLPSINRWKKEGKIEREKWESNKKTSRSTRQSWMMYQDWEMNEWMNEWMESIHFNQTIKSIQDTTIFIDLLIDSLVDFVEQIIKTNQNHIKIKQIQDQIQKQINHAKFQLFLIKSRSVFSCNLIWIDVFAWRSPTCPGTATYFQIYLSLLLSRSITFHHFSFDLSFFFLFFDLSHLSIECL